MVYARIFTKTKMATKESEPHESTESNESKESKISEAERNIVRAIDRGDSKSTFELLMTDPTTGGRMSYEDSRMQWG